METTSLWITATYQYLTKMCWRRSQRDQAADQLNQDVLLEILKRSSSCSGNGGGGGGLRSHMRFSRVCSSWRYAAATNPYKLVPWLMLSKLDSDQETRSFFGLDDKQFHEIKLSEEANSSWCSGSSDGWLVMSHETSGNFLYNPITQERINLPLHSAPETATLFGNEIRPERSFYLTKAIVVTSLSLSSSSSASNNRHDVVAVAAIFAENKLIGFCRPGDKEWQVLTVHLTKPNPKRALRFVKDTESDGVGEIIDDDDYTAEYRTPYHNLADVILYRGALYAITHCTAMVGVFKFDTSSSTSRVVMPEIQWLNMLPMKLQMGYSHWNYLVESCDGELLMVVRRRKSGEENCYKFIQTWRFLVFKLDESSDLKKWVRIESLGDQILFLGMNHSISIRASDIPGSRGNCIYFTADFTWCHLWIKKTSWPNPSSSYMCNDAGVFYLEDGRIETTSVSFVNDVDAGDLGVKTFPPSTVEYPAIFITPSPSLSSTSFTVTHDNHSLIAAAAHDNHNLAAARDLYTLLSSSKCLRYAIISILVAGTASIVIWGTGMLNFLKPLPPSPMPEISPPPPPPMPESSPPRPLISFSIRSFYLYGFKLYSSQK